MRIILNIYLNGRVMQIICFQDAVRYYFTEKVPIKESRNFQLIRQKIAGQRGCCHYVSQHYVNTTKSQNRFPAFRAELERNICGFFSISGYKKPIIVLVCLENGFVAMLVSALDLNDYLRDSHKSQFHPQTLPGMHCPNIFGSYTDDMKTC